MVEYKVGQTLWRCPECHGYWIEDGEGAQDEPAECGPCGHVKMSVVGELLPDQLLPEIRRAA